MSAQSIGDDTSIRVGPSPRKERERVGLFFFGDSKLTPSYFFMSQGCVRGIVHFGFFSVVLHRKFFDLSKLGPSHNVSC